MIIQQKKKKKTLRERGRNFAYQSAERKSGTSAEALKREPSL
jgi:hypothetical protein